MTWYECACLLAGQAWSQTAVKTPGRGLSAAICFLRKDNSDVAKLRECHQCCVRCAVHAGCNFKEIQEEVHFEMRGQDNTVSADCRLSPLPAARMLSRKMKASDPGWLKRWIAFSLQLECILSRFL